MHNVERCTLMLFSVHFIYFYLDKLILKWHAFGLTLLRGLRRRHLWLWMQVISALKRKDDEKAAFKGFNEFVKKLLSLIAHGVPCESIVKRMIIEVEGVSGGDVPAKIWQPALVACAPRDPQVLSTAVITTDDVFCTLWCYNCFFNVLATNANSVAWLLTWLWFHGIIAFLLPFDLLV